MYKHLHSIIDYDIKWDIFADTHAWLFLTWDDSNGYIGAVSSPVVPLVFFVRMVRRIFFTNTVHIKATSMDFINTTH